MTGNPPNCSTCAHNNGVEYKHCSILLQQNPKGFQIGLAYGIAYVGCLSHPQAREYLMGDVIAELENRHNTACKQYHDTPCYLAEGNIYEVKRYTLEDVIKLIKEGVKE